MPTVLPVFAANILLALPETPDQVDRVAESDRFGYYRIESLPPGRYLLRVQRIGYGEIDPVPSRSSPGGASRSTSR